MRKIVGLKWAEPAENPWPKTRPKGVRAKGLAFERRVARAIPGAKHGLWFRYEDQNGVGYCSPDLVLRLGGVPMVLECKLTDCPDARDQLEGLYLPVLECLLGRRPRGVVVVKNLTRVSQGIVPDLASALAVDGLPLVQWLGKGEFPIGRV